MNILTLNYEYPPIGGGAAPVARDVAEGLAAEGHHVTVVTMRYGELAEHETVNGVEIYRLRCWRSAAHVCHPWEQLTYITQCKRFLKAHMREHSYDVCHCHFIIPTGVIAKWLKRRFNVPYVLTAHGSDVMGYNQKRFRLLHRLLLKPWRGVCRAAAAVTAPSDYLCGLIRKADPSAAPQVVPNGLNTARYKVNPKKNIVLTLCRLQEPKDVQTVIRAVSLLPFDGWTLHIAGDGPYRKELEALAAECADTHRIVFDGWVENMGQRHLELLADARIFVSVSWFENFSISASEALLSGCRVILGDIPSSMIFVQLGATLVPLRDPRTLADAIQKEMRNEQQSDIDGIRAALSISNTVSQYERLLYNACNMGGKA